MDNVLIPSYDPHTQKLVTSTNENGETFYSVESYSVEEMNDGSQWYVDYFKAVIQMRLELLETQVLPNILNSDPEGLQAVYEYKNNLLEIKAFPAGFKMPEPPVVKNVSHNMFLYKIKSRFKFKNTMKVTTL
jgi:hypothetical protein